MRHLERKFYIVSAERFERTAEENREATKALFNWLHEMGLPNKMVEGFYGTTPEVSALVVGNEYDGTESRVFELARFNNQESVLVVHEDRSAELVFTNGEDSIDLGRWNEITASEAKRVESYTFDPYTERYYACSKTPRTPEV
jgi:hypothetical protein